MEPTKIAPASEVTILRTASREVFCKTSNDSWTLFDKEQFLEICNPVDNEADDGDFTISNKVDPTILAFGIVDKKKVKFLPIFVFRAFPELIIIRIYNCSVTLISENHFKGSSKLDFLNLRHNEIKKTL